MLTGLCRRSFEHVQCAGDMVCNVANDQSDLLILAGRLPAPALAQKLRQTLSLVRTGGVVVAQLEDLDDDVQIEATLKEQLCEVRSTVFDLSHEVLVAHRIARCSPVYDLFGKAA